MRWRSSPGCARACLDADEPAPVERQPDLAGPALRQQRLLKEQSAHTLSPHRAKLWTASARRNMYRQINGLAKRQYRKWAAAACRSSITSGTAAVLPRFPRRATGLGLIEDGLIAADDGRIVYAGAARGRAVGARCKRADRLRRPLDHAGPDRLPYPSGLWRRPRPRIRTTAGGRELRRDRARRRRHRFDGDGDAAGQRPTSWSRRRCRGSTP